MTNKLSRILGYIIAAILSAAAVLCALALLSLPVLGVVALWRWLT